MAYDETLADRVRAVLTTAPGFSEKKMFGGVCFLIHGNMCCGILQGELILRAEPAQAEAWLKLPHVRSMDFTGRPMKGFVIVEAPLLREDASLGAWSRRGLAFAQTLPRKPGKARAGVRRPGRAARARGARPKRA